MNWNELQLHVSRQMLKAGIRNSSPVMMFDTETNDKTEVVEVGITYDDLSEPHIVLVGKPSDC